VEEKMGYTDVLKNVGKTPLVKLELTSEFDINLYAKLESYNPTGSIKDRSANYVLRKLLNKGIINKDTTIIESSSGNFGIALANYCKKLGLKFHCVIDPNICTINEMLIKSLSNDVTKVTVPDETGGYLLTRIKYVKKLLKEIPNSYWINQYANPHNAEAYCNTLGKELGNELENIDYIFIAVSSGGTITGLSKGIKELHPNSKVIAVDSVGSVVFGGEPKKRYIPGMGSSMTPEILKYAQIDDVVMIEERHTVKMCHELLNSHNLFMGGSSGAIFGAVKKYFKGKEFDKEPNVVMVFPDRGDRYAASIYDGKWIEKYMSM